MNENTPKLLLAGCAVFKALDLYLEEEEERRNFERHYKRQRSLSTYLDRAAIRREELLDTVGRN